MKKSMLTFVSAALWATVSPAASVEITSCTQNADTKRVTVAYTLSGGPAIVTFSLTDQTGAALPAAVAAGAHGAVNKLVASGDQTFQWTLRQAMTAAEIAAGVKVVITAWAESNPPDYMVVDASTGDVTYYEDKDMLPGGLTATAYKSSLMPFRRIAAKGRTFVMGSDDSDYGHLDNETKHNVTLTNDFWMGVYPVTQGQYKELMNGSNPSYANDLTLLDSGEYHYPNCQWRAVERVSYASLRGSCDWPNDGHAVDSAKPIGVLRTRTGIDRFDLPTEAEWEFACRAGTTTALYNGKNWSKENVKEIAWVGGNSLTGDQAASIVGLKDPNDFGLYDMLGTICELCLDWYSDDLGSAAATAPTGPSSGTDRVIRGGGMASSTTAAYKTVRSAARQSANISSLLVGFRLACAIPVAADDASTSDSAEVSSFAASVVSATEATGHGTIALPFEAWDRDFGTDWIERFTSFPPIGVLLFLR